MICRLPCPTGKSHSLLLRHLIHDHCLFVNAFVSLGCSRIPFTFTFPPASLACFHVWWCVFHLLLCTRPQDLLSKPRTSPEHQLCGFKIPFLGWCLSDKYFQSKSPLLNSFYLGVWEIWNSTCLKSTIFPPKLLHTATAVSVGGTSSLSSSSGHISWSHL